MVIFSKSCFLRKKIFTDAAEITGGICSFTTQLQSSVRWEPYPLLLLIFSHYLRSAFDSIWIQGWDPVSDHIVHEHNRFHSWSDHAGQSMRSSGVERSNEQFGSPSVSTPLIWKIWSLKEVKWWRNGIDSMIMSLITLTLTLTLRNVNIMQCTCTIIATITVNN